MRRLIKSSAKKALWPFLTKPWDTPDMEFHYGLWNGVSALFCDSGRQLGEENARPLALNWHVDAETLACKYPGSREGRLINMSALRTAMQNFDAALAITDAVRKAYLGLLPADHTPGIWDLNTIARASISLVAYQKRFVRQAPPSTTVSDALTSQYQFISGVYMICRHMIASADPVIGENRPINAEDLYRYADEHGIFVSFNGMACAGSAKKIHEFLDFCNAGGSSEAQLGEWVSEPDNWLQYALAAIELDCLVEQARAMASGKSSQQTAQMLEDMRRYLHPVMDRAPELADDSLAFEQAVLARQNRILNLLGRPAISAIPRDHFTARLA